MGRWAYYPEALDPVTCYVTLGRRLALNLGAGPAMHTKNKGVLAAIEHCFSDLYKNLRDSLINVQRCQPQSKVWRRGWTAIDLYLLIHPWASAVIDKWAISWPLN